MNIKQRIEKDFIGEIAIPATSLFGIHASRAKQNFPNNTNFHIGWYKAMGLVKLSCYETYSSFIKAAKDKYQNDLDEFHFHAITEEHLNAIMQSAREIADGQHFEHFIVPAISGGAGTSINMNINEIIANRALQILRYQPGDYHIIDPIEHANIFQSTNDVVPTALKAACMKSLQILEDSINKSRTEIERLENLYRNTVRIGYTQMQEAVPTTFGRLFSSYSEAFSRDWWRVSKAYERIKVVNLGGSAIGTGLTVPRFFIMEVVQTLKHLTGLPLTRSDNLADTTSNLDSFVEVHAILKAHAVNLEKMTSDIRLLAADLFKNKTLSIPAKQAGSSIMPGKVNPVIPEFIISSAHKIYANDMIITNLSAQGVLELNAYLPLIGHVLLESLDLLINANNCITEHLLNNIIIDETETYNTVLHSPAVTTVLIPYIGYKKATDIATKMKETQLDIISVNEKEQFIEPEILQQLLEPYEIIKLGYSLNDIQNYEERKRK